MDEYHFLIPVSELRDSYQKGFIVPLILPFEYRVDLWAVADRALKGHSAFFLDSVRFHPRTGHYSYLGWEPFYTYRAAIGSRVLKDLRSLFRRFKGRKWDQVPFFSGGAVGYFSYELARSFEKLPSRAEDDLALDLSVLLFVRDLLVYDHRKDRYYLISNLIPELDGTFDDAFQNAMRSIERNADLLLREPAVRVEHQIRISNFKADIPKRRFKAMVRRAKLYIGAGDIYQANLSQRFSFQFQGEPEALYESLRKINPSPFSSYFKTGALAVTGVSPERLIRRSGTLLETRPIAGTRPRGRTPLQNQRLRKELITSPKERAEHIMLVDLERNDLGRICETGSVKVKELMGLEEYSHVVHIVSNIQGRLRKGCDQFDVLRAVFPGGTITGCPKIRSMEIIEELEPFRRHLYTGSVGYLDFNGDMDLNIIIRTIVLHEHKGYLQVGAGIVYDSDAEAEYWETLHKGQALMEALSEHSVTASG